MAEELTDFMYSYPAKGLKLRLNDGPEYIIDGKLAFDLGMVLLNYAHPPEGEKART